MLASCVIHQMWIIRRPVLTPVSYVSMVVQIGRHNGYVIHFSIPAHFHTRTTLDYAIGSANFAASLMGKTKLRLTLKFIINDLYHKTQTFTRSLWCPVLFKFPICNHVLTLSVSFFPTSSLPSNCFIYWIVRMCACKCRSVTNTSKWFITKHVNFRNFWISWLKSSCLV